MQLGFYYVWYMSIAIFMRVASRDAWTRKETVDSAAHQINTSNESPRPEDMTEMEKPKTNWLEGTQNS